MKITSARLRHIIREEFKRLIVEGDVNYNAIRDLISKYDSEPSNLLSQKEIESMGVPINSEYTYHVVYGQIVSKLDDKDVAYWSEDLGRWEIIDDNERHHPVKIHKPS